MHSMTYIKVLWFLIRCWRFAVVNLYYCCRRFTIMLVHYDSSTLYVWGIMNLWNQNLGGAKFGNLAGWWFKLWVVELQNNDTNLNLQVLLNFKKGFWCCWEGIAIIITTISLSLSIFYKFMNIWYMNLRSVILFFALEVVIKMFWFFLWY